MTPTGSGNAHLPISRRSFFSPNGSGPDNRNGFQTAVFKGIPHIPVSEPVKFRIGGDDVAFPYLNGGLIAELFFSVDTADVTGSGPHRGAVRAGGP